jgi:hypothetical protein
VLRWEQHWAPHLPKLRRIQEQGRRVPAIENKPELYTDLEIYFSAYVQLRQAATERIQLSEMLAYCELMSIEDREEFVWAIQMIERSQLETASERTNNHITVEAGSFRNGGAGAKGRRRTK